MQQINPPTIYHTAHLSTVLELVRLGLGVSLVPACAIQPQATKGVVFRQMSHHPIQRTIVSARHQGREKTLLTTAFSQFLQDAWHDLTQTNAERS